MRRIFKMANKLQLLSDENALKTKVQYYSTQFKKLIQIQHFKIFSKTFCLVTYPVRSIDDPDAATY